MIWQVFDLIRTRRTPAHSYTQTVMCVCLIGLAVLNERIQWMASEFHCSNAIFHPSSSFAMRRHAFRNGFLTPSTYRSLSICPTPLHTRFFGVWNLPFALCSFSVFYQWNWFGRTWNTSGFGISLFPLRCEAICEAGFAFCCFFSAFFKPRLQIELWRSLMGRVEGKFR